MQNQLLVGMPIGQLVREIRKRHGHTMTALGRRLRVTPSTISQYESGKITPGAEVLHRLCDLANTEERRLLESEIRRQFMRMPGGEALLAERLNALENYSRYMRMLERLPHKKTGEYRNPDLAAFVGLANHIIFSLKKVDSSINEILQLWCSYAAGQHAHRGKLRCFRDAAAFLRVQMGTDAPARLKNFVVKDRGWLGN